MYTQDKLAVIEALKVIDTETAAIITIATPFKLNKKAKDGTPNTLGVLRKTSQFNAMIARDYSVCYKNDTGLDYEKPQTDKPSTYEYISKALSIKDGEYYLKCAWLSNTAMPAFVSDESYNVIPTEVYLPFKGASKATSTPSSFRMIKLSNIHSIILP